MPGPGHSLIGRASERRVHPPINQIVQPLVLDGHVYVLPSPLESIRAVGVRVESYRLTHIEVLFIRQRPWRRDFFVMQHGFPLRRDRPGSIKRIDMPAESVPHKRSAPGRVF
jgi:hypothetical protein